jgi:hypothetical protein
MATARGFLRILKARHVPLYDGRCAVEIKYSAEELYAANHRPDTEVPKPKDSGKADDVAFVETSFTIVVPEYGLRLLGDLAILFSSGEAVPAASEGVRRGVSVISCCWSVAAIARLLLFCSCAAKKASIAWP